MTSSSLPSTTEGLRTRARRRALRAAQAVSMCLALATTGACSNREDAPPTGSDSGTVVVDSGSGGTDGGGTTADAATVADSGTPRDSGVPRDSGSPTDAGRRDAGAVADAGRADSGSTTSVCGVRDGVCPPTCSVSDDPECCEMGSGGGMWFPGGGCAVPGPFVPPTLDRAMA